MSGRDPDIRVISGFLSWNIPKNNIKWLITNIPLKPWKGGGCAERLSLPFLLPFIQNYHEAPIPENSWTCKTFCCGNKNKKFSFTLSQSTLKYGSENRPWVRGLTYSRLPRKGCHPDPRPRRGNIWRSHRRGLQRCQVQAPASISAFPKIIIKKSYWNSTEI